MQYALAFAFSFLIALTLTPLVMRFAHRVGAFDYPTSPRKIHDKPIPMFGGIAVFLAFFLVSMAFFLIDPTFFRTYVTPRQLFALLLGGAVLIAGGMLDDKYRLSPRTQILFPLLAVSIVVFLGDIRITLLSNPFGGVFDFSQAKVGTFPYLSLILAGVWLIGMIYTTKFLDGMDGLVAGMSGIGGLVIAALSLLLFIPQPEAALLAFIFAGASLGFLRWNFHPAKIFLGEGGSTFAGFMLGALSIVAGGKIATALLVMGIPVLDVLWVIVRRIFFGSSPFVGDRKHLHFRLLDIGLSQRRAVAFLWILSLLGGITALSLQASQARATVAGATPWPAAT